MIDLFNGEVDAGIDVGFSTTKALLAIPGGDQPDLTVIFPSVYGAARNLGFDEAKTFNKYPGDRIIDEGGQWFVGKLAQSQLREGEQFQLRGRESANPERLRLTKVALGKLFEGHTNGDVFQLRLSTGLPVAHMKDAASLKKMLLGTHVIETDLANVVIHIIDVSVMPQPYGTKYAMTMTSAGEHNPDTLKLQRVGVADLGEYTFDIALDDNGEYIDSQSDSKESGVHLAKEAITRLLETEYNQKPKQRDVETVLRTGHYRAFGEDVDYTAKVNEALEPVRIAVIDLMRQLWKRGTEIDVIYLSGGGAPLIEKIVQAEYKHAVCVPDSQLANARGYLNYALWKRRQQAR
jgi:hypothetical protein